MNNISIVGRLGADPQFSFTPKGIPMCRLNVAVKRKDNKTVDWFPVVTFGTTAENVNKYLKKGRMVALTGEIQFNKYKDDNNNDRISANMVANNFSFVDASPKERIKEPAMYTEFVPNDENIPF